MRQPVDASDLQIIRAGRVQISSLYDLLAWRGSSGEPQSPPPPPDHASKAQKMLKMLEHIESDSLLVWVAQLEKREDLAGYVSVAKILKPDGRVYFYIDELWVPKPFRRNGIASRLLDAVIETAQEMEMWCIRLVAADTDAARNLYCKAGFDVKPGGWAEMML